MVEFSTGIPPYFRLFQDNPEGLMAGEKAKGKRQKASAAAEAMAEREGWGSAD
jgi:hypothetical protein